MNEDEKQVKSSLHSDHKSALIELNSSHTQIFQQICNAKFLQEQIIFQF